MAAIAIRNLLFPGVATRLVFLPQQVTILILTVHMFSLSLICNGFDLL
jgi:hypothetical protein